MVKKPSQVATVFSRPPQLLRPGQLHRAASRADGGKPGQEDNRGTKEEGHEI